VAVVQGVDVQSDEQVAGMAEALAAEGGGAFDIVVNNAGYFWEQAK
jgi:NAD(P)-dependent dehydrogenase (short-subunit alcohol dehydrogenase family)